MKAIVTTTINPPTEAILKFSSMNEWNLYIVGDLKTPHEMFSKGNWKYLSPEYQEKKYPKLSSLIEWNNIQRRNIGFIEAVEDGAEIIATIDDDNIPKDNWGKDLLIGKEIEVNSYSNKNGIFDPLSVTNISEYWHRGYPLELVNTRFCNEKKLKNINVKVQVGLWDGKPDVDCISRIMNGYNDVNIEGPFPYSSGHTILSSQNAFFHRSIMPYFLVLPYCGRMDDIWGSILLQQKTKCEIVFTEPSTYHDRNYHDPIYDLKEEIIGHELTMKVLKKKNVLPPQCQIFIKEYEKKMKELTNVACS